MGAYLQNATSEVFEAKISYCFVCLSQAKNFKANFYSATV